MKIILFLKVIIYLALIKFNNRYYSKIVIITLLLRSKFISIILYNFFKKKDLYFEALVIFKNISDKKNSDYLAKKFLNKSNDDNETILNILESTRINSYGYYKILENYSIKNNNQNLYLDKFWINTIGGLFYIATVFYGIKVNELSFEKIIINKNKLDKNYLNILEEILRIFNFNNEQIEIIDKPTNFEFRNRYFNHNNKILSLEEITRYILENFDIANYFNNKFSFSFINDNYKNYGILHLRNSSFKDGIFGLDDMRNVNEKNIYKSLETINNNKIIQLGDNKNLKFSPIINKNQNLQLNSRFDITLLAKSNYVIGCNSGMSHWALIFNKPAIYLDVYSLSLMPINNNNNVIVPKIFNYNGKPVKITKLLSDYSNPIVQTSSVSLGGLKCIKFTIEDYTSMLSEFIESYKTQEYFDELPVIKFFSVHRQSFSTFKVPNYMYKKYYEYF